jgi:hypothetical protein
MPYISLSLDSHCTSKRKTITGPVFEAITTHQVSGKVMVGAVDICIPVVGTTQQKDGAD